MEIIKEILLALVTACVPVLATYGVKLIKSVAEKVAAETDNTFVQGYIEEISDAICTAVSVTNQTYVDSLKSAGEFTADAQQEALQTSLSTATSILSAEAKEFIENVYGDVTAYLTVQIEAEVRAQKISTGYTVVSTLDSVTTTATPLCINAATEE